MHEMEELEKSMYYGAKPDTLAAAKILHENMTLCEKLLWERYSIKVIRFTNSEVENIIHDVIKIIENEVKTRIQSPPWGI
jgi:very-short-patch-repair endonuclease